VVREVIAPSYCCNPLTVATGKRSRLVLDGSRFVNPYVQYAHFKYEDWSVAEQVIQTGCGFLTGRSLPVINMCHIYPVQCKYPGFAFHWPVIGQRFFCIM